MTDTVGFIRKLPHNLIEAFKSTLEEAKYADMIIHVVDCSNDDYERHMATVYETLKQLDVGDKPIINVINTANFLYSRTAKLIMLRIFQPGRVWE